MFEPIRRPINRVDNLKYLNDTITKLDNPLCRLFKKNKLEDTLIGTLNTTRSSSATYVDMYGVLKTAAIGVPRQGSNGWLSEGTSTNKWLYSTDFTNDVWAGNNRDITLSPANDLTNLVAYKVTPNTTYSIKSVGQQYTAIAGDMQTVTWILKAGELKIVQIGSNNVQSNTYRLVVLDLSTGEIIAGSNHVTKLEKIEGGAYIVSVSFLTEIGGISSPIFQIFDNLGNQSWTNNATDGLYFYAAQIEALEVQSSLIVTTNSSLTRSSDENSIQYNGNVPRGDQPFTIRFKGVINGYTNLNRIFGTETDGLTKRLDAYLNSSGNILFNNGSDTSQVATSAITFGEVFEYIITSDGVTYTSYLNGTFQAESPVVSPATELSNELRVLRGHSSTNDSYGSCLTFEVFNRRIIWT